MSKKTYFVNIASREISQIPFQNNATFKISATSDEVQLLRDKMNGIDHGDHLSFARAHIPIYPYHNDKGNDLYDDNMIQAYQLIYELGDDEARSHIESIGIISD
ncbi:MAG TPA: hydrolase [Bacillota bacterium]|nr:hydrolase [Bacillota bacterium]